MVIITELSQLDLNGTYNYVDYLTWQVKERLELIKGKITLMSPAPSVSHQRISFNLSRVLGNFFYKKSCQAFAAPFDVRLYNRKKSLLANKDVYTVVQPDLCVICNPELLDERGCNGAPDWIIEILSKGNSKKEMQIKHALYAESGVLEYWIVFPFEEVVLQYVLNEASEQYQLIHSYAEDNIAIPHLFPELEIDLKEVFNH
jgi:Uma2 family endonuclease